MSSLTKMNRENMMRKKRIRGRFKQIMGELDKKLPNFKRIKTNARKINTEAFLIVHNKKAMMKNRLSRVM